MAKTNRYVELHQSHPRADDAIIRAIDDALMRHREASARTSRLRIACVVVWQDDPGFVEVYGTQWAGVAKIEIEDLENEP